MSLRTSSVGPGLAYKHLMESDIPGKIGGEVKRNVRQTDFKDEDIVIRETTITTGSRQEQFVDILFFTADIKESDTLMVPNLVRLEEIANDIKNLFNNLYRPAYQFRVSEMQDTNEVPGADQHYSFTRLLFQIYEPIEL